MCDNTCLTAKHRSRADIQERSTNLILTGLSGTEKNFWRNSTGSWWYSRRNLWSNCKKEEQTVRKANKDGTKKEGEEKKEDLLFQVVFVVVIDYTLNIFLFIRVFDANKTLQNGLPVCVRRWLLTFKKGFVPVIERLP